MQGLKAQAKKKIGKTWGKEIEPDLDETNQCFL